MHPHFHFHSGHRRGHGRNGDGVPGHALGMGRRLASDLHLTEHRSASDAPHGCVSKELHRARHELQQALATQWSGPPQVRQRIIDILARATAEIGGT